MRQELLTATPKTRPSSGTRSRRPIVSFGLRPGSNIILRGDPNPNGRTSAGDPQGSIGVARAMTEHGKPAGRRATKKKKQPLRTATPPRRTARRPASCTRCSYQGPGRRHWRLTPTLRNAPGGARSFTFCFPAGSFSFGMPCAGFASSRAEPLRSIATFERRIEIRIFLIFQKGRALPPPASR